MPDLSSAFIPRITSCSPTTATTDVGVRPTIEVTFTLDMMVGTLVDDQAAADQYINDNVILAHSTADVATALEFVSYNARTRTVSFRPAFDLDPGESYTVTILASFAAATGRSIAANFGWNFTVAVTAVTAVELSSPIDGYSAQDPPVLVWEAVDGGTVTYDLQVSSDASFSSPVYDLTDLAATSETELSDVLLSRGVTYYWHVRAVSEGVTGAWSNVRAFRFAESTQPAASGGTIFDSFGLVSVYPPAGTSNLSDWPIIQLVFNRGVDANSVADGIGISGAHVDTGAPVAITDYTTEVVGSRVNININDAITSNTRYTVSVFGVEDTGGRAVAASSNHSFTAGYLPLYATADVLRSDYGRFLVRYTDDELSFQLHRASMKANRLVSGSGAVPIAELLVNEDEVTYNMVAYVVAYAAFSLIQLYQFELMDEAGRRRQLDTMATVVDATLLSEIGKVLAELEEEVKRLEQEFRGDPPSPKAGVKSSQWNPGDMYTDTSISQLGRAKF